MKKLNAAVIAGLTACSGGTVKAPTTIPIYYEDEPNDILALASRFVPDEPKFLIEGNMETTDLDYHMFPIHPGQIIDFEVDYAAGWDMEVQVFCLIEGTASNSLWGGYDSHGLGYMSGTVEMPAGATDCVMTIRHTQTPQPDETRYTFTVETF